MKRAGKVHDTAVTIYISQNALQAVFRSYFGFLHKMAWRKRICSRWSNIASFWRLESSVLTRLTSLRCPTLHIGSLSLMQQNLLLLLKGVCQLHWTIHIILLYIIQLICESHCPSLGYQNQKTFRHSGLCQPTASLGLTMTEQVMNDCQRIQCFGRRPAYDISSEQRVGIWVGGVMRLAPWFRRRLTGVVYHVSGITIGQLVLPSESKPISTCRPISIDLFIVMQIRDFGMGPPWVHILRANASVCMSSVRLVLVVERTLTKRA